MKNTHKNTISENSLYGAVLEALSDYSPRTRDIVFLRYGSDKDKPYTLDAIGKKYSITRERVRQIVQKIFTDIKKKKPVSVDASVDAIMELLIEHSGILEEDTIINHFGQEKHEEKIATRFLLDYSPEFTLVKNRKDVGKVVITKDFNEEKFQELISYLREKLTEKENVVPKESLYAYIEESPIDCEKEACEAYMEATTDINPNPYGDWGLSEWREVTPRGTREKAYLVLKYHGKPMHFSKIAKAIENLHDGKTRKINPQTVHNELIKGENFTLVGRGVYGLSEWGMQRGTVRDIIENILKKSDTPLSKEEIVEKVLEERQVKNSTILVNLKKYFTPDKKGFYFVES